MNQRQAKKNKKRLILFLLEKAVCLLDDEGSKYNARILRIPSAELKTVTRINGYRIEIRSTREDKHNYAHFHVVKGTDGRVAIIV